MSIGRALRFRILQRDNFTCQYCGQRAPDVVLEIDHINPRAQGGLDRITNLLTACFDCNQGKKDSLLNAEQVESFAAKFTPPVPQPKPRPISARPPRVSRPVRRPQHPQRDKGIRVAVINGGTFVDSRKVDSIPVSSSFVYVGPDTFLSTFRCADCGFANEYEGDGCGCDRRCRHADEDEDHERYIDNPCERCEEREVYDLEEDLCEYCLELRVEDEVEANS